MAPAFSVGASPQLLTSKVAATIIGLIAETGEQDPFIVCRL
jgi:hypothetical protein